MDAMCLTQDVSNAGYRGRPPLAREVYYRHELVMDAKGNELGELVLEPQEDGSVSVSAVVGGKTRTFSFPAPASKPRKARAKKAA